MGYHPSLGRFAQRDPGPGGVVVVPRVDEAGPTGGEQFIQKDATMPYGDGMSLYQYAKANPIAEADPLGLQSRVTTHFSGSANADILRKAAQTSRAGGWTFAPDLLERALNGGGNLQLGSDSNLAKALGAAFQVKNAVNQDIENKLPEGAGALDCGATAQITISGQVVGVTFSGGELEAAVRSPDEITYRASLNITRVCDGTLLSNGEFCCDAYLYYGTAVAHLRDQYDYHAPTSPDYAGKSILKKGLLGAAYSAQQAGFLTPYEIQVDFMVNDLEGEVCAE